MKRLVSLVLTLCLVMSLVPLAYAEDSADTGDEVTADQTTPDSAGEQTEDQDSTDIPDSDDSPVKVGTLEELQAAIDAAKEGDTIILSNPLVIEGDCNIGIPEKRVVLIGDGGFSNDMITMRNGTLSVTAIDFDGGNVIGGISCTYGTLIVSECNFSNMYGAIGINYGANGTIVDCNFTHNDVCVGGGYFIDELKFSGCTFTKNYGLIACISAGGNITIEDCRFEQNSSYGDGCGAVFFNSGTITISDCSFIGNKTTVGKGAAISNGAELTISNCFFDQNASDTAGDDIFNLNDGTVTITDTDQQMSELYSRYNLIFDGAYEDNGVERSFEDHFMHEDEDTEADNADTRENRFVDCETSTRIPMPATQYSGGIHFESHEITDNDAQEPPKEQTEDQEQQSQEPPAGQEQQQPQEPPTGDDNGPQEPSDGQEGNDTDMDTGASQKPSDSPSDSDKDNGYETIPRPPIGGRLSRPHRPQIRPQRIRVRAKVQRHQPMTPRSMIHPGLYAMPLSLIRQRRLFF